MKVLFLDIDGVLNTPKMTGRFGFDFIDTVLVALVARIVKETECKIVLSSTWRIDERDRFLATRELAEHGLTIHDCTPVITRKPPDDPSNLLDKLWQAWNWPKRHEEIQLWLDQNPVSRFAILDDLQEACIEGSFFKTDEDRGITVAIAEQIIQHLNDTN
jgi:hypothetical protein